MLKFCDLILLQQKEMSPHWKEFQSEIAFNCKGIMATVFFFFIGYMTCGKMSFLELAEDWTKRSADHIHFSNAKLIANQ